MKTLKLLANFMLPAVLFPSALLLGFAAAALSAGIEYSVISGIIQTAVNGTSMALLIVICLEGYKIFLHLYISIAKNREKALHLKFKSAQAILVSLVMISLSCTFFWTTHVMYADVIQADDAAYTADVEAIDKKYDAQIEKLEKTADAKIEESVRPYKERYDKAHDEYTNYQVDTRSSRIANSLKEKKRLKDVEDEAFAEYTAIPETEKICSIKL